MARRITSSVTDFSGGVIGGVSDYRRKVRHLRIAENVVLRPLGALAVRLGSQRLSTATLAKQGHTALEWVTGAGTGHIFVGCDGSTGALFESTAVAFTQQTCPYQLQATSKMVGDQLQGSLWIAENAGAAPPIFYRAGNPANTFHSGILPRPAFPAIPPGSVVTGAGIQAGSTIPTGTLAGDTTLTLSLPATATAVVTITIGSGFASYQIPNVQTTNTVATARYNPAGAAAGTQMTLTGAGGGALTAGITYFYRLRFRYTHGAGRATANTQSIAMGANTQVQLTTIAQEIRSDYLGWTLERTKQGGTAAGPFYWVADGTGAVYNDVIADADLGYRSNENVHGEPPHLDGVLAFKDRLVGWAGSTLYVSQAVGDIEATGIANWNALSAIDIGPDDGDTIKTVVQQVDRLVVLKRWTPWGVEGDDIESFRAFPLGKGAGAAGSRSACALGQDVYFWGDAGFHRLRGNVLEPFGWTEVGHLFDSFKPGQYADVVVRNYLGQYVLVGFSSGAAYNDDLLAFDVRFGGWVRYRGWFPADILVQKAGSFVSAQAIVMVDRRDLDAGAGFDYPVWLGFAGFKDEKAADGSAGLAPTVVLETPMIDDGTPSIDKDWERIQVFLAGTNITATVVITTDPQHVSSLAVAANQSGAIWGVPLWGAFTWAQALDVGPFLGLPDDTLGRRYSLRLVATPIADFVFKGYVMDGKVLPTQDYSEV